MSDDAEATRAIAHDLNNLVTIVSMGCELLRRRFGEGDPSRALVDDISEAATRAGELTRRLLALSPRAALAEAELPEPVAMGDAPKPPVAMGDAPKPPGAMGAPPEPPDGAPST
jgi:signal transduction histidine kinase